MTVNVTRAFIHLCQQAVRRDLETLDCTDVEPILLALLHLVTSHPRQQPVFVKLFIAVADGEIITPEYLLPFCMRELRFPEIQAHLVRECAGDQRTARFVRRMNFISHVLHAFDEGIWEDAKMWPYYRHEITDTSSR